MYRRSFASAIPRTHDLDAGGRLQSPEAAFSGVSELGVLGRNVPGGDSGVSALETQPAEANWAGRVQLGRAGPVLLQLQRKHGNRYVQKIIGTGSHGGGDREALLVQTRLVLGAAQDDYEREADRVAEQVVSGAATSAAARPGRMRKREEPDPIRRRPAIQRVDYAQGDLVDPETQRVIRRATKSRGQPIPEMIRGALEGALGADFRAVRVHADSTADRLSRSLQARAFTTGQHIFFRRGEYHPGTSSGRRTLAHELTHVIQQTGGRATAGQASMASSGADSPVQRLVSKEDFQKLAGEPSKKSKLDAKGGTYTDILKKLKDYETFEKPAKKTETLKELKRLCTKWISKHTLAVPGSGERNTKKPKDLRKAEYMPGLLEEVKTELGETHDATVVTPAQITQAQETELQATTALITKDLNEPAASRYVLTLLASVENPDLLPFAEKRLALTIENKTKIFGKQKTGKQIKKEAASRVVEEKGEVMTDVEREAAIQDIIDASGEVGHTWVKLRKYDKDDKILANHSFGFYPLKGYNRPELAVPGEVVYGDQHHDHDPDQLAKDYQLTAAEYGNALQRALGIMAERPDYKLVDYNCTAFAKQVVRAAGQEFPGNAFMRVPANAVSAVSGIGWGKAYNPNALYGKMKSRASVYIPADAPKPSGIPALGAQGLGAGELSTRLMIPPLGPTLETSSLEDAEEASQSESLVGILASRIGEQFTLRQAIAASPVRSYQQTILKVGTAIMLIDVSEDSAKFDVARAGYHVTKDLDQLCAALGLMEEQS